MHSEMFPLLDPDNPNPLELFQIWLNLPPESKMVPAYFGMLWSESIPTARPNPGVSVDLIAGSMGNLTPPSPPPDSWASREDTSFAIWLIRLATGSSWELPGIDGEVNRMLHAFVGDDLRVAGATVHEDIGVHLDASRPALLENHGGPAEFLLLQGRPIGAPVFQLGPFVMNSPEELRRAVEDYHRTRFGGWPWSRIDPVHDRAEGRFAIHADGKIEHRDRQRV